MALLLVGTGYLGLVVYTGTTSPFLLVSGTSMEPTLHEGDLLLTQKVSASDIQVGDLIAFSIPQDAQQRLRLPPNAAHRVIRIEGEGGSLVFVTKGDNSDIDPFKVSASALHGQVIQNLGPLGRPFMLLSDRATLLLVGLPVLTFILIVMATLWLSSSPAQEGTASQPARAGRRPAPGVSPVAMNRALNRLALAVSEYGTHLQSHTAVVQHLAGTSDGLEKAVHRQNDSSTSLNRAVRSQNAVLADLAEVVRTLRDLQPAKRTTPKARARATAKPTATRPKAVVSAPKAKARTARATAKAAASRPKAVASVPEAKARTARATAKAAASRPKAVASAPKASKARATAKPTATRPKAVVSAPKASKARATAKPAASRPKAVARKHSAAKKGRA